MRVCVWKERSTGVEAALLSEPDEVHEALAVAHEFVFLMPAEAALEAEQQGDEVGRRHLFLRLVAAGEQLVDAIEEGGACALGAEDLLLEQVGEPVCAARPQRRHVQELVVREGDHDVAHGLVEVIADLVGGLTEGAQLLIHEAAQLALHALDRDVVAVALDVALEADDQAVEVS